MWLLLALIAGTEFYALVAKPGVPEDRRALEAMRQEFGVKHGEAATADEQDEVLRAALHAISEMEFETAGAEGSAGRVVLILSGELGVYGPPFGPLPNAEVDDFEGDETREEAAELRQKLNDALAKIYSSEPISRAESEEMRRTILSTTGPGWPYDLALDRLAERSGTKRQPEENVGLGMLMGVLLLGGLGAWIAYFVLTMSGMKPKGLPRENDTLEVSDNLALRFLLFIGAFAFLPTFAAVAASRVDLPGAQDVAILLVMLAATGLILSTELAGVRMSLRRLGVRFDGLWGQVAWGVGGFLANIPVLAGLLALTETLLKALPSGDHPVQQQVFMEFGLFKAIIGAVIMAPIIEEIFFRGCLYQGLAARSRSWVWPVVLSSVAFASLHPQGMQAWLVLGWIGGMGAMLFRQTGSLVPAIVMHALNNLGAILLTVYVL